MLLQDEIERSFGDGPAHRPVDDRLQAGRRAVRRRRATTAVAALAVVAVVGASYSVVEGVGGDGAGSVASQGEAGEDPNDEMFMEGQLATYDAGEIVIRPGVQVVRKVENPLGFTPPDTSVGLVLEYRGETTWMLMDWSTDGRTAGGGATSEVAGRDFSAFDLWLDHQVRFYKSNGRGLELVAFDGSGALTASEPGVDVLEQRAEPAMPRSFAAPREETAVARVTWNGDPWFVLARRLPGYEQHAEYFPTESVVADGATTIDEFLAWARVEYANEDVDR